jgi:hypothetical protein
MKQLDKSDEKFLAQFKNKYSKERYFTSLHKQRKWACVATWFFGACLLANVILRNVPEFNQWLPFILFLAGDAHLDDKIKLFKLLEHEGALKTEHKIAR